MKEAEKDAVKVELERVCNEQKLDPNKAELSMEARKLEDRSNVLAEFVTAIASRMERLPEETKPKFAVFLTQEPAETILSRAVHGFRFVEENQITTSLAKLDPKGTEGKIAVIHMPLEAERQQEQLIDVFEYINAKFCLEKEKAKEAGSPNDPKQHILVVVDNAETIRMDAYMRLINRDLQAPVPAPAQTLQRSKEFCKLLREYCFRHRLRTWFSFEEEASQSTMDEASRAATAAETYAADATIRLGNTVLKGGFRERTLEIIKARDQYYRRGCHHFTIRGYKPGGMGGPSATEDQTATGIIVFPSMPTQQHRMSREGARKAHTEIEHRSVLGIPEIDAEVRVANANNADPEPGPDRKPPRSTRLTPEKPGYLCAATVSVLVSDLDSVGTDLALHFVAQGHLANSEKSPVRPWLYISMHHELHMLRKIADQYESTEHCVRDRQLEDRISYGASAPLGRCLYFPPEYISESKLLYDIDEQIRRAQAAAGNNAEPLRVVVDDLFALEKRFPLLRDRNDFVAALFELFRCRGVIALVLDTVEVGEGRNPVEQSVPAGMADHVFLMRHLELQNTTRKVFSILKLAEFIAPPHFWDISRDGALRRLVADADKFQFLKGLLSGKPEPVQITLSLYGDSPNSPQHLNLQRQEAILSKTFGHKIDIQPCHPEDYAVLQQTVGQMGLPVLGDCHIISIDEIWLEQLIAKGLIVGFLHGEEAATDNAAVGRQPPHWDTPIKADGTTPKYVTVAHDLAVELHPPRAVKQHPPPAKEKRYHFGIPDRHNCGVLCYYDVIREVATQAGIELPEKNPRWDELVRMQTDFVKVQFGEHQFKGSDHPRNYHYREPEGNDTIMQLVKPLGAEHRYATVRPRESEVMPLTKSGRHKPYGVFTFGMENRECCVSFLLELVLSKLATGKDLVTSTRKLNFEPQTHWVEGLKLMFQLLDPWDICRLAHCWFRPTPAERPCLYSRQWFTSWGALGLNFRGLEVHPLPPGPGGIPTPVSGTWYLGMLKGSSAISAGKALIQRLTDPHNELHRFNYGIAMPVWLDEYEKPQSLEALPMMPYAAEIVKQTKDLYEIREAEKKRERTEGKPFLEALRKIKCPFHRPTIADYSTKVSPVLMGLIVKTARGLVDSPWNCERKQPFPEQVIKDLVTQVSQELGDVVHP